MKKFMMLSMISTLMLLVFSSCLFPYVRYRYNRPIYHMEVFVERAEDGTVYLIENPGSRSRISYVVTRQTQHVLAPYVGRVIYVDALLLRMNNPWFGELRILSVYDQ
jgi:hypothetical protein